MSSASVQPLPEANTATPATYGTEIVDKELSNEANNPNASWHIYPKWQLKLNDLLNDALKTNNSTEINKLLAKVDRLVYDCARYHKPQHFPRLERVLHVLREEQTPNLDYAMMLLQRIERDFDHETRQTNRYIVFALLGLISSPAILVAVFYLFAMALAHIEFSTQLVSYTLYDAKGTAIIDDQVVPLGQAPNVSPDQMSEVAHSVVNPLPRTVLGFNKDLVLLCGLLGVIGSIVSMVVRLGELGDVGKDNLWGVFVSSLFRPFVGFCFAILLLLAVQAGFLPFSIDALAALRGVDELMVVAADSDSQARTQASLVFVMSFLAGFSERLGRNIINKATSGIDGEPVQAEPPAVNQPLKSGSASGKASSATGSSNQSVPAKTDL